MSNKKLIVRIKGGLGNQLFCYAAAKRLAEVNSAELVVDNITGFIRDSKYGSKYQLHNFNLDARIATPKERLEPLERYRRGFLKIIGGFFHFDKRKYIVQEKISFDKRILGLRFNSTRYIDGLWQSEKYFVDISETLRKEFTLKEELDKVNKGYLSQIKKKNSVALHYRWFDSPGTDGGHNLNVDYYKRSIELIRNKVSVPHFFLFSDNPDAAIDKLPIKKNEVTVLDVNQEQDVAYKDMWLMSHCKSIIMANSTFSWWGAWLGEREQKLIICPKQIIDHEGRITSWNFEGQLPQRWKKI